MTRPFRIEQLRASKVSDILALWEAIDFEPSYQRQADIWERDKRQLFIDSLINGYDIPKLYFHDLSWTPAGRQKRYAIIDGKQRLQAIHLFVDGSDPLSDDFEDIEATDPGLAQRGAGLLYKDLAAKHPDLKARLDQAELPIVLVQTPGTTNQDLETIEEMFSRLNEAVPLNAPEKRNALGGPLPKYIRRLANSTFFSSKLAFPNARYRHLDLAAKFLYTEYQNGLADLKKRDLDNFVREFKARRWETKAARLFGLSTDVLRPMSTLFAEFDQLLGSVGMVTVYYLLFREASAGGWLGDISRDKLLEFEEERARNRARVKEAQELALQGRAVPKTLAHNPVLAQFERYVQSPNDFTALSSRVEVLRRFVRQGRVPSS